MSSVPWGPDKPPYIIAEISGNHNGNMDTALALIEQAKKAGADAVKFQAYEPDTITIDHNGPGFILQDGPWAGNRLYDLYSQAYTPFKWFEHLFKLARSLDITPMASVFDPSSVDLLEGLGCPIYKIASFELVDIPLIKYVVKTGKPIILSTGMATDEEISQADDVIPPEYPHMFLHCISGYPTPIEEASLGRIPTLAKRYQLPIGFSDHTLGVDAALAATALGAQVIEKHLTLSRADGGPDAGFSLEPAEFADMATRVRGIWAACRERVASPSELPNRMARRSLYVVKDISCGEPVSAENVRSIRPAYGLPPVFWEQVVGRLAVRDIAYGTPLSLDDLEG